MLNFAALRKGEIAYEELVADLTRDDLIDLTNEMIDDVLKLIADCTDADVVFVPEDPDAYDPYAENKEDEDLAWTLGHVIVHITSSSEESAALAAELARGVEFSGRSRYETPWQTVTTIAQCRQRLEESRRMRLASLEMWPDEPKLDNTYAPWEGAEPVGPIGRFVYGLLHAYDHLEQIAEIVRQAQATR
jgi:hypothetical protein